MLRDFGCPSSLKLGPSDCNLTHGSVLCAFLFSFLGGMGTCCVGCASCYRGAGVQIFTYLEDALILLPGASSLCFPANATAIWLFLESISNS